MSFDLEAVLFLRNALTFSTSKGHGLVGLCKHKMSQRRVCFLRQEVGNFEILLDSWDNLLYLLLFPSPFSFICLDSLKTVRTLSITPVHFCRLSRLQSRHHIHHCEDILLRVLVPVETAAAGGIPEQHAQCPDSHCRRKSLSSSDVWEAECKCRNSTFRSEASTACNCCRPLRCFSAPADLCF